MNFLIKSFISSCLLVLVFFFHIVMAKPTGVREESKAYRWTDDDGVTHYSDQIPPDQIKHRRSVLNKEAQEVQAIDSPKTLDQLRQEQQLKLLRVQQEKVLSVQRDLDQALLRTYRSVEEMYAALKGKLELLDSSAKIAESNRQRQKDLLASQEKQAADMERHGQPVPKNLRDLISAVRTQIANYDEKLRRIEVEKQTISERFTKDIARFEAIKTIQSQNQSESYATNLSIAAGKNSTNQIVISAVACAVGAVCDRAWALARAYVLKYSSNKLIVDTDRIIQTPSPTDDNSIGITVTRIASRSEDILFLDVHCRPTSIGETLCSSPQVTELRAGFKTFIETQIGTEAYD